MIGEGMRTGPVSKDIRYHLTQYDHDRIKRGEKLRDGLRQIAAIAERLWYGFEKERLASILQIQRIAEELLKQEIEE